MTTDQLNDFKETLRRLLGMLEGGDAPVRSRTGATFPLVSDEVRMDDDPAPWLTYAISLLGEREVPGSRSNPKILTIIREFLPAATDDSTTAWCGAFVAHCLKRHGMDFPRDMPLLARAYLDTGNVVSEPRRGDLVVFWRVKPNDWRGHVAFYLEGGGDEDLVKVVGGNQTNAVTTAHYRTDTVLGYRRPTPAV